MTMNKKDYEAFAEQFRYERDAIDMLSIEEDSMLPFHARLEVWNGLAIRFAALAYVNNRRFSCLLFFEACGMDATDIPDAVRKVHNAPGFFRAMV